MGRFFFLLPLGAVLLLAADIPSWTSKPVSQWDGEDARQIIEASPWAKTVDVQQVRNLSPDERRYGGDWDAGIGAGVGIAGTGIFGPGLAAQAIARAHEKQALGSVIVRWESSPVRAAEFKLGLANVVEGAEGFYSIAVCDINTPTRWNTANELKGVAFLKRDKKKDLKPARVEIVRRQGEKATVIYLFRRSNEITGKDRNLRFVAQIGRLFVAQFFFPEDMQMNGRLEL